MTPLALAILTAIIASAAWFARPRPADTYPDETGDCRVADVMGETAHTQDFAR